MSRVFVVQDQKQVNTHTGELESKFDMTPAEEYGQLIELLRSGSSPFNLGPAVKRLHKVLHDFTDDDYLLLVGNPVLIGMAVAVAAHYNGGSVACLQWSGAKSKYIPVRAVCLNDWQGATQ